MEHPSVTKIRKAIAVDPSNAKLQHQGLNPLFSAHPGASIVIIGQAPGKKTHEANRPWDDKSGEQLRRWMGVPDEIFYDQTKVALVPMDFYFPGKGKTGDLPPRKEFAEKWHTKLWELMPNIQLKILIGQYSQAYYLPNRSKTLTETVKNFHRYTEMEIFPLPHPSPRNNIWKSKNPWFETDVVPALQKIIKNIIDT